MTLVLFAAAVRQALAETGGTVVSGPPFTHPPAGPCYAVGLPRIAAQDGRTPVFAYVVDVRCYPSSAGNYDQLLTLADTAAQALADAGYTVTVDPAVAQYLDADLNTYTMTVEES